MAVVIIIGGGGAGGGGQKKVTVQDDGSITDDITGATVAKFDTVADAIAYLNHLVVDPSQES